MCSQARLMEELLKIVKGAYSPAIFSVLVKYNLLKYFLPSMDKAWGCDSVDRCMGILKIRCHRLKSENFYSDSRVLALGTVIFPFISKFLQGSNDEIAPFWSDFVSIDQNCRRYIIEFFHPLTLPRYVIHRLVQMLLLLPKFKNEKVNSSVLRNSEYMYSRELYSILVEYYGWDDEQLAEWPKRSDYVHTRNKPKSKVENFKKRNWKHHKRQNNKD